jgi:hypothetical protein
LFTFAWTTSALVTVVTAHRKLVEQLEEERVQEMHMRFALRKQEWDALKSELGSERQEVERASTQATGASFLKWLGIRWAERKQLRELRRAKVTEIEELRRKERENERKLGPGDRRKTPTIWITGEPGLTVENERLYGWKVWFFVLRNPGITPSARSALLDCLLSM